MDAVTFGLFVWVSLLSLSTFGLLLGFRALARNIQAFAVKTNTVLTGMMLWTDVEEEIDGKKVVKRTLSEPFVDAIKASVQSEVAHFIETLPKQLPSGGGADRGGLTGMIMEAIPKKYAKNPLVPILIQFATPMLNKFAGGALGGAAASSGGGLTSMTPFAP